MEKKQGKIIEVEMAEIDWYVINRVKQLRTDLGISQEQLSIQMGLSERFVGKVETLTERAKYNLRHLSLIAKALGIGFSELLPPKANLNGFVKIKARKKKRVNKDGTQSQKTEIEIVEIVPIKTESKS
jgi:transcriptional regulator with XRE-family HTH domain